LEKTEAWQKFAGEMDAAWQRAQEKRLKPVQEFQAKELGGAAAKRGFVFYPFSGPGVMHMRGFCPKGKLYGLA